MRQDHPLKDTVGKLGSRYWFSQLRKGCGVQCKFPIALSLDWVFPIFASPPSPLSLVENIWSPTTLWLFYYGGYIFAFTNELCFYWWRKILLGSINWGIKARNPKKNNYCSDFRNEINGIFVLGWVFFFWKLFNQPTLTEFLISFKSNFVVLSLNLKRYFTCDYFSWSYGGLKVTILADLGQLTRDIFRAINAFAEIQSLLKIVPYWLKEACMP